MLRKLLALAALCLGLAAAAPTLADGPALKTPPGGWSFSGPLGMYDQEQLQRGFKVYVQVCSACHAMNYVAFHQLGDPGAPCWSPKYPNPNDNPYVKAIAASWPRQVTEINADTGDPGHRPATTADVLVPPFPNDAAAKASNGGALPPDMSLLVAAREGGPDYVYSIVISDGLPTPAGMTLPPGKYYDPYFTGGAIGMPPPLTDCKVTFDDGKPCDVASEARDVSAFLQWASDPKMNERKQTGLAVLIYLVIFSGVLYLSYRAIWRNVGH